MTIDEMKLAVASLLPDRVHIRGNHVCWRINEKTAGPAVMETEWLHVCWLAEKTLTDDECWEYGGIIEAMASLQPPEWEQEGKPYAALYPFHTSPWKRLEAICRVKFPHLFEEPPVSTFHKTTT